MGHSRPHGQTDTVSSACAVSGGIYRQHVRHRLYIRTTALASGGCADLAIFLVSIAEVCRS